MKSIPNKIPSISIFVHDHEKKIEFEKNSEANLDGNKIEISMKIFIQGQNCWLCFFNRSWISLFFSTSFFLLRLFLFKFFNRISIANNTSLSYTIKFSQHHYLPVCAPIFQCVLNYDKMFSYITKCLPDQHCESTFNSDFNNYGPNLRKTSERSARLAATSSSGIWNDHLGKKLVFAKILIQNSHVARTLIINRMIWTNCIVLADSFVSF